MSRLFLSDAVQAAGQSAKLIMDNRCGAAGHGETVFDQPAVFASANCSCRTPAIIMPNSSTLVSLRSTTPMIWPS